jgi:exodeoxyribonuclease V beta subunit
MRPFKNLPPFIQQEGKIMQRFDCLKLDCPLFGPHLLEASAGTGKTFSIEHIYVRLVMEGIVVEEILAVTFTRAATRELKGRIRANLERALRHIEEREAPWEYLTPHLGSEKTRRLLSDAIASFDRCQIFTIHGFCYRMLKEFAFEAKVGALVDPDKLPQIPEKLKKAAIDFLENGIDEELLCLEQLYLLTKEFESFDAIVERLVKMEESEPADSFSTIYTKCKAALQRWNLEEALLFEDFFSLSKGALAKVKGDFEGQLKGLIDPAFFPLLLKEKGSLFDYLSSENRKVKATLPERLNYPGFFEWARGEIAPLFKQKVFPILQGAWQKIAQKILEEEEYLGPDKILIEMKEAIENEAFRTLVQKKYNAAIIDEFQDTDPMQWDIFQRLFLSTKAVYLVGDPKQSIYRFRKADVYTYLKARDLLGEEHLYHLDTNFRSSKKLIDAINALFHRDWLHLPKEKRSLPYHPVNAGAKIHSDFSDEKGALHFMFAKGEPSALFDEAFLPYAVSEIERLQTTKCALLVKDRYQAERALEFFRERGIPAIAKSHTPLGKTFAFQAIRELFMAIFDPKDFNAQKIVMAGPFGRGLNYKEILEEQGLIALARELPLDADGMQIFEWLFTWEQEEGFSIEGLKGALNRLENLSEAKRRMEVDEEAVQIMTLHISKGLEFDIVFALSLASRTPSGDSELDAEKLRQFYVAMTRAKKRLYVPIALSQKEAEEGTHSPMELFSQNFKGPLLEELSTLAQKESITMEELILPLTLAPCSKRAAPLYPERPTAPHYSPSYLSSFTTLANPRQALPLRAAPSEGYTLQTMPRGAETGIAIHKIFELIFTTSRDPAIMDQIVEEEVSHSPLKAWKEAIQQMVKEVVLMPLQIDGEFFHLGEIDRFQVEMEFLFSTPPNFVKGFIDLVFYYRNKVYFLDWKTNYLEDYGNDSLKKAMEEHDYPLQAALYAEAIHRHFKAPFGGAFYLFVRGKTAYYLT